MCDLEDKRDKERNDEHDDDDERVTSVNNEIYFYTGVNKSSVLDLHKEIKRIGIVSKQISIEMGTPEQEIVLHINSPGGSAVDGILASDLIRSSIVPVLTVVEGECSSAATIMSVSGHKRSMMRNSVMLIHQLSTQFWGSFANLQDEMANCELLMSKIIETYLVYTKIPKKQLSGILKHDLFFDAETCLKYKLIDRII